MRLLLDTHVLIWWLNDDAALSYDARQAIASQESEVFVSAASVWEIAIKQALGKLDFPIARMAEILDKVGLAPLGIEVHHAILAGSLPRLHADPFDRMLIAQAQHEGMTIVTADPLFRQYAVAVREAS